MKLAVFYASYVLLILAFILYVIGVSSNDWWEAKDSSFSAGLWKIKLGHSDTVDYQSIAHRFFNGSSNEYASGWLVEEFQAHLYSIRTLVVFFVILFISLILINSLIVCFICRGAKVTLPKWLQLTIMICELASVIVGLITILLASNSKKLFKQKVEMKSSWHCVIFSNIFNFFSALLLLLIFIKDLKNTKTRNVRKTFSSEMINNDIHMRQNNERDNVTNYTHANNHDLPITTGELEWDDTNDTNWKIDEYGLGTNSTLSHSQFSQRLDGSHVNIGSHEEGEQTLGHKVNKHLEHNNIQSHSLHIETTHIQYTKEEQYKKLEISKTAVKDQQKTVSQAKTQNGARARTKPRLPRPDKTNFKQNDGGTIANNNPMKGEPSNHRRNSETREQLRNILEIEQNRPEHQRYRRPTPKNKSNKISSSMEKPPENPTPINGKIIDISDFSEMDDAPSISMASDGERTTLTDLSNFSEVDLGRLQSESFRNKSVKIRTANSFTNKIPYFLPADETS